MKHSVLIVDESYTCRWQLQKLVESISVPSEVYTASNGLDAMEIMTQLCPDILITSINLTKLNGLTLLKRICQTGTLHVQPQVIIMHEFNRKILQDNLEGLQLLGFLDKPPSREGLDRLWPHFKDQLYE